MVKVIKIGRELCGRCKIWSSIFSQHEDKFEVVDLDVEDPDSIPLEMRKALVGKNQLPFLLVQDSEGEYHSYDPRRINVQEFIKFAENV